MYFTSKLWTIIFQNFFRISPGFCFADGLASLALLRQDVKNENGSGVFDWNVTGGSICYLAVEVLFSVLGHHLLIIVEILLAPCFLSTSINLVDSIYSLRPNLFVLFDFYNGNLKLPTINLLTIRIMRIAIFNLI